MGQYVFRGSLLVVQSGFKHVKHFHLTWKANTAQGRKVYMAQDSIWVPLGQSAHTPREMTVTGKGHLAGRGWVWKSRSWDHSNCRAAWHTAVWTPEHTSPWGEVNCETTELAINTTGEYFLLYFSPFDAEGITGWLDLGKTPCFWFVKSYYSSSIIKKTKWW